MDSPVNNLLHSPGDALLTDCTFDVWVAAVPSGALASWLVGDGLTEGRWRTGVHAGVHAAAVQSVAGLVRRAVLVVLAAGLGRAHWGEEQVLGRVLMG